MSLPRRPHAVVFDMDGLIFDTERLYRDAMMGAAEHHGRDLPLSVFTSMIGGTGESSRRILADHFGPGFDLDTYMTRTWTHFHELAEADLALKAGVGELLDLLDRHGTPRAIATSSNRDIVNHHLAAHDLARRFDTVVAQGDYARGKPHPDPYLEAARRLGVAPEVCLALEDSHNGVRAASSAGMMTIMVPDLLDPTEEMRTLCVRIAQDLHEVRELLISPGVG
jgi:HAD superfamily hydrolase (TIGR01509 family)